MKLTILLLTLLISAGCHKPKPKTPPPPCAADLFGCWPEEAPKK